MKVSLKKNRRAKCLAYFTRASNETGVIAFIASQLGHTGNAETLNWYIQAAIKNQKTVLKKGQ